MTNRVILIEDNQLHGRLYSAVFRAAGFLPVHISDPRTAWSALEGGAVAALVVDIRLPHIDGRDIIRQVRGGMATRFLPIVAVSAFADHDMEEACLAAGADRFRAKPVPVMTLARDVEQLIEARAG